MDDSIKLWDLASGKNTATLKGHDNDVYSVAFSPDGKTLASGSIDETIKLWDVVSHENTATLDGDIGVVLSVAFNGSVACGLAQAARLAADPVAPDRSVGWGPAGLLRAALSADGPELRLFDVGVGVHRLPNRPELFDPLHARVADAGLRSFLWKPSHHSSWAHVL